MSKRLINKSFAVALGAIVLASLMPVASATSAQFNNASGDFSSLRVSNYTKFPGSTANWGTSVSADPSDVLSFNIFYHNTSNVTATNTRLKLNLSPSISSGNAITGLVFADNASTVGNGVVIYLNSGSNVPLTLVSGSARWYTGSSAVLTTIPFGQSGDETVNSSNGLRIGDVPPGGIGQLVIRAQLGGYSYNQTNTTQGNVPSVSTNSATVNSTSSATLYGSVNPNNSSTNAWFEYGQSQSLGFSTNTFPAGGGNSQNSFSSNISNLSSNTTYYYRIAAQNSYGTARGSILSFTTLADQQQQQGGSPIARTDGSSGVSTTSVTLMGSANPNGASTDGWFEYGTSQSLGTSTSRQGMGAGTSFSNFSSTLTNLSANTTYYFRAMAQNNLGTNQGTILSFTTQSNQTSGAPIVVTNTASGVSLNSATLQGSVNPNNSSTTGWFEYGTSTSFGSTTSTNSIGSGSTSNAFSFTVFNLASNNTYYFRAVAQNNSGISYGSTLSFSTQQQFNTSNAPTVTTSSASVNSSTNATLYGYINPNNSFTTGWFEYGPTTSLGLTSSTFTFGSGNSSVSIYGNISGLNQGSNYYYRAVGQNGYGTSYGNILNFSTGFTNTTTVVNQSTDLSGIQSSLSQLSVALAGLIGRLGNTNNTNTTIIREVQVAGVGSAFAKLNFTADKDALDPGDKVVLTIEVEPLANLTNASLVVKLDSGLEFDSTNATSFTRTENVITYNLGSVSIGNIQTFKINAHLSDDFTKEGDNQVVTSTATFSYSDSAGKAATPLSSSLEIKVGSGGFLASIFGAFSFGGIFTILLIALLLLLIAVAVRRLLN